MEIAKYLNICLLTLLLAACPARNDLAPNTDEVRRELTAQADAWDRDIVAKNVAAIAANMADDFKQIRGSGREVSALPLHRILVAGALWRLSSSPGEQLPSPA